MSFPVYTASAREAVCRFFINNDSSSNSSCSQIRGKCQLKKKWKRPTAVAAAAVHAGTHYNRRLPAEFGDSRREVTPLLSFFSS